MKKFLVALVVMLSLSSCAQVQNAGAAAIVEGNEISVADIAKQYSEIIADLDGGLKPGTDKQINRSLISAYIVDQLVYLAASEIGVAVSDAKIQVTKKNYISMFGGKQEFIKTAAENGIARSGIWQNIRTSANFEAIGVALDPTGNSDTQSNAAVKFLVKYGKRVDISVNPRFGQFLVDRFSIVDLPVSGMPTIEWQVLKIELMPNQKW